MLLIHSDVHFLVSCIAGSILLGWLLLTRKTGSGDTFSTKSMSTTLVMFGLLAGWIGWGIFGAMIKYHYGYVQIPYKVHFLQRPYSSYPRGNAWLLWLVEMVGLVGHQFVSLGLYLGLAVLWNAILLVTDAGTNEGYRPLAQGSGQRGDLNVAAGGRGTPLVNVKRASWIMIGGSLILLIGWTMQALFGILGRAILVVLIFSIWFPWLLMVQAKIKTVLLTLNRPEPSARSREGNNTAESVESTDDEQEEPAPYAYSASTNAIPKFRVQEQVRSLNIFSALIVVQWLGLVGTLLLVGHSGSPFWLDLFSSLHLLGTMGSVAVLLQLLYPTPICCYLRNK